MNIFLIGLGNMGLKRLETINYYYNKYNLKFIGYFDPYVTSINFRKNKYYSLSNINKKNLNKLNIDICIISTPHDQIYKYSKIMLSYFSKIVLIIEKPYGINYDQAKKISNLKNINQKIFIGLNYRFFEGINSLINDIKNNKFGKLNNIHISMGHGHGSNLINSWKLKKNKVGGGVIIDPGIHLINLIMLITDNKAKIKSVNYTKDNFWNTGVEEQANLILSSHAIPLININLSIIKWRSEFSISVFGNKGYGIINGRGSHYGKQVYKTGIRWKWETSLKNNQIDTEKTIIETEGVDVFHRELETILKIINFKKVSIKPCDDKEALKTMKIIHQIYEKK